VRQRSDEVGPGHNHCRSDPFSVQRIGDGVNGGLGDAPATGENRPDLLGRDLLAAAVDDVLDASGEEQISVLVQRAQITSSKPAVGEAIRSRGRVSEIAGSAASRIRRCASVGLEEATLECGEHAQWI
jgi:hypothetical protein